MALERLVQNNGLYVPSRHVPSLDVPVVYDKGLASGIQMSPVSFQNISRPVYDASLVSGLTPVRESAYDVPIDAYGGSVGRGSGVAGFFDRAYNRVKGVVSSYVGKRVAIGVLAGALAFGLAGCTNPSATGSGGGNPPPVPSGPSVTVQSPQSGSEFGGPASFYVRASSSGASEVDFKIVDSSGSVVSSFADKDNSNGWSDLVTNLAPGSYTIKVQALDSSGNAGSISSVGLAVDNGAPPSSPAMDYWLNTLNGDSSVNAWRINDSGGSLTADDKWFLQFLKNQMSLSTSMPVNIANILLTQVAGDNGSIWNDEKNVIDWNYNGIRDTNDSSKVWVYGYEDFKKNGWMPQDIFPTYVDMPKLLHPFFKYPDLTLPVNGTHLNGIVTPNYSKLPEALGGDTFSLPDWTSDTSTQLSSLHVMNSAWAACDVNVDGKYTTSHDTHVRKDYVLNKLGKPNDWFDFLPFPLHITKILNDTNYGFLEYTVLAEAKVNVDFSPSFGHQWVSGIFTHLNLPYVSAGAVVKPEQAVSQITFDWPGAATTPELDWNLFSDTKSSPRSAAQYYGQDPKSSGWLVDSVFIDPNNRKSNWGVIGVFIPLAQDSVTGLIIKLDMSSLNTTCGIDAPMIYKYGN